MDRTNDCYPQSSSLRIFQIRLVGRTYLPTSNPIRLDPSGTSSISPVVMSPGNSLKDPYIWVPSEQYTEKFPSTFV